MSPIRTSIAPIVAAAIAAAFVGTGTATATSITTTSYTSWKSSLIGAPSPADFNVVSRANYNTADGLTLPMIGNSSVGFVVTGPNNGAYQMVGTTFNNITALAGGPDAGAGLNVATPGSGVNAFLLSVGSIGGGPLTLTLSDGESFSVAEGLFGITISHPISSFLLTTTAGSQAVLDDLYSGTSALDQDPTNPSGSGSGTPVDTAPVAEGATSLMLAGGLLILFGAWRKSGVPVGA